MMNVGTQEASCVDYLLGKFYCTLENDTDKKPHLKSPSLIISVGAWTVRILLGKAAFSPCILTHRLLFPSETCNCKSNSVVREVPA